MFVSGRQNFAVSKISARLTPMESVKSQLGELKSKLDKARGFL